MRPISAGPFSDDGEAGRSGGNAQLSWVVSGETVRISGELDLATVAALQEGLIAAGHPRARFLVDLRELTFVDSSGLFALIKASEEAAEAGGGISVLPGPATSRLLEVSGLTPHFDLVDGDADGDQGGQRT